MATAASPMAMEPSDWRGAAGDRWAANVDNQEGMLADIAEALLDHAGFAPGERVVEIGCGGGALTRALAARVAPDGEVVGFDISPALVELANARAAAVSNCRFVAGDAETDSPPGAPFDRLTSRFGIMFFPDPARAMANLRAMLKPGGRFDAAVWAPAEENPLFSRLQGSVRAHLSIAPPPPYAPGPLAFSDADYFGGLLTSAGFRGVTFTTWRGSLRFGPAAPRQAAERILATSSLADPLARAGDEVRAAVAADLERALAQYETPTGIALPTTVHLVTAYA